ncbi:serpin family protein [Dactylosporangium sp. CA-139066]|uniref:serpin family protein n=1 Tax=Dactylosporangium sp. CA-139066 TaxID=3239930 RepID=UPI003D94E0A2
MTDSAGRAFEKADALTARWAATLGDGGTVLSGAGAYVLLGLLGPFAGGAARDELLAVAPEPLDFPDSPAARLAAAVWSRAEVPLREAFEAAVPPQRRGRLTGDPAVDRPVLDSWAAEWTGGLIPAFPLAVGPDTLVMLASALSVRTEWAHPFTDGLSAPADGPWAGRHLAGLRRTDRGPGALERLRVAGTAAGPLTLFTVDGAEDVDVVLALGGPGEPASAVLPAAIGALRGAPALPLEDGPGVRVEEFQAAQDAPECRVSTVRFRVEGSHDLLAHADVFGLAAASDPDVGHFPGVSPVDLAVSGARQDAVAEFTAQGFRAAAVTAVAMALAAAAPPMRTFRQRRVYADFDRPFGFLAVHRPTGLVLVAGWVSEPAPYQEP